MMRSNAVAADAAGGRVRELPAGLGAGATPRGHWQVNVYDATRLFRAIKPVARRVLPHAEFERLRRHPLMRQYRETRVWENLVTNAGLDYLLSAGLDGGSQITTWYLGLIDDSPTVAAGDTMASHAGWVEVTAYDEANRQTWTGGTVSGQSVDNVGNEATFTISADSTDIGGAFLVSNNTKGGTTGTLYAAGAFSGGDLVLNEDATLDVTATFTQEQAA